MMATILLETKMKNTQDKILTAYDISSEVEMTSSAYIKTSYTEFERFVESNKFTCIECALDRLFEVDMISGYIAETCSCASCGLHSDHEENHKSIALINALSQIQGSIVSDNIRVLAQNDFEARKIANHLGNDYSGADFTTLADLVACEMDTNGHNFPFSYDDVVRIIHDKEDEAEALVDELSE